MIFLLLSVYFILDDKLFFSSLSLIISFFFRYFSILYFPFLLILVYLRKQKALKFFVYSIILFFLSFSSLVFIFGEQYISQTIFYHFQKVGVSEPFSSQYWQFGYFTFFLSLISAFISYAEKKKVLLLFSLIPLIVDSFLLVFLKINFYHYFLLSLPFCVLASTKVWKDSKSKIIKLIIPAIVLISIFSNLATLDFYLNPMHARKFYEIVDFIENCTTKNEAIFGEPVATNFASFILERKISGDYFDSYLSHLKFEGEEKVVEKLNEEKPKVFIEMKFEEEHYFLSDPSFQNFLKEYRIEKVTEGIPTYLLMVKD
jgi:hypothetical protein